MHVYWVQVIRKGRDGKREPRRIAFETPLESVDDIVRTLEDIGVVSGYRLDVVDDGYGAKLVRRRSGFAFGDIGLVSIEPIDRPIRDAVPE